jgi:hypothetical protein
MRTAFWIDFFGARRTAMFVEPQAERGDARVRRWCRKCGKKSKPITDVERTATCYRCA